MLPEFTADGIEVQTFDEIYTELSDGYKTIYGSSIDLSVNTPDGQRIAIEAQARLDLQSYALALYNQLDPNFAVGNSLNRLIKFAGISRNPAVRSYVSVTINTDRVLALPENYIVEDTLFQHWVTTSEQALSIGDNTVVLYSENFGAYSAGAGTVITPVTIVIGVNTVTNPAIATIGEDEETDEELRIRRNLSLETPSTSTIGGLYTAIGDIDDVTDLKIYENYTDSVDAVLTLDAHTIWCIVEGGSDADIGEAIAKTKTAGCGLKGTETGTYDETITLPDGSTFVYSHEMAFDRPTDEDLYITLDVKKRSTATIDEDLIKEALVATLFGIGETVYVGELYDAVYSAGSTFIATSLEVSLDDITYTAASASPSADGRLLISTAKITITEI